MTLAIARRPIRMRAACGVLDGNGYRDGPAPHSRPDEVRWRDYKQHESQRTGDAIAEDGQEDPQRPRDGVGHQSEEITVPPNPRFWVRAGVSMRVDGGSH